MLNAHRSKIMYTSTHTLNEFVPLSRAHIGTLQLKMDQLAKKLTKYEALSDNYRNNFNLRVALTKR
jgi:hypothetical protein